MECPVCGDRLRPIDRYGVEVDICPGCKGVWLDRGELDKIIELVEKGGPDRRDPERGERSTDDRHRDEPRYREEPRRDQREEPRRREEVRYVEEPRYREYEHDHKKRKRRGGWLGDLLEGFGDD